LQQRLGLKTADLPVVGIITRLTQQKGIHLIKHAIWRTLERNGQVIFHLSPPLCQLLTQTLFLMDGLSEH
jgi:glycogen synthase